MKKSHYIIGGAVMIALGAFWLLRVLGVIPPDFTLFFDGWWTLFILVPSVMGLFASRDKSLPIIGILLGTVLLLAAQGVITWAQMGRLIVPGLVIVIGGILLVNGILNGRRSDRKRAPEAVPPQNEIYATFSSRTADYRGQDFTGTSLNAVFGSIFLDLTGAMIAPDAVIRVYVVFGSVEICLPENTAANVRVVPIFGAAYDGRAVKPGDTAPAVQVNGTTLFGSVKVK